MKRVNAPTGPIQRAGVATAAPPAHPVLQLQRAVGNRATRALIQREPATVTGPAKPTIKTARNEGLYTVIVEMSDGSRYRVTRTPDPSRAKTTKKGERPKFGWDSDADRVWLKLSWCRGARGEVRVGGNPQGAARKLLEKAAQEIADGKGADGVATAIRDAEIEPFTELELVRAGDWRIDAGVTLTVDRTGVTGAKGSIEVQKGPVSIEVEGSSDNGGTIIVSGKYKGKPPEAEKCKVVEELVVPWTYACTLERDVPEHFETRLKLQHHREEDTRYLYFQYKKDELDAKRSATELSMLNSQVGGDWHVIGIDAFASPEGPQGKGPGFEGNDELASKRAAAALTLAQAAPGGGDKVRGSARSTAKSELYDPGGDPEQRGRKLEEHVVQSFLADPREARHRTPEVLDAIARARTAAAKAQIVYPFLRRAEVKVERRWEEHVPEDVLIEAHTRRDNASCPTEVLDQAKSIWSIADATATKKP